jgi:6-phosphogluconolactonase
VVAALGSAVDSRGTTPTHVRVDRSGRWVFAANYSDGVVGVFPIQADGSLGEAVDTETPGEQAHAVVIDPTNRYLFVPCKGSDRIAQFVFDAATGQLTPNTPPSIATAADAGPRHLALHPDGAHAYSINELDSTVTAFALENGVLRELHTLTSLPSGFRDSNTGAEIAVHPNGRFVYASNRGHNSLAIFAVGGDGRLTAMGHEPTQGNTPRSFSIEPGGQWLLVANQNSRTVFRFDIGADGMLTAGPSITLDASTFYVGAFAIPR